MMQGVRLANEKYDNMHEYQYHNGLSCVPKQSNIISRINDKFKDINASFQNNTILRKIHLNNQ